MARAKEKIYPARMIHFGAEILGWILRRGEDGKLRHKDLPNRRHKLKVILNKNHLLTLQSLSRQVPIANDIKQRAVKIIGATRSNKDLIQYGASPRASIGLILAAKARALIQGRNHVSNEDLNFLAFPILRHRIILNFEAERKGMTRDDAIRVLIDKVR